MHVRPAVAGFFRALKWVWFPAFGGVAVYPRTDAGYQGMAGAEKGFREEADGNHAVTALTAVDAGHFPLGFAHFHAGFQIVALVAVGFALAQA